MEKELDISELMFIMYRDDLKHFKEKWRDIFEKVGYLETPTSICNSMVGIERELESLSWFKI